MAVPSDVGNFVHEQHRCTYMVQNRLSLNLFITDIVIVIIQLDQAIKHVPFYKDIIRSF